MTSAWDDFVLGSSLDGAHPPFVDWPIGYGDLAPFYDEAETLLGVAGVAGLAARCVVEAV